MKATKEEKNAGLRGSFALELNRTEKPADHRLAKPAQKFFVNLCHKVRRFRYSNVEAESSWLCGILLTAWLRLLFSSFGPVRRTPADGWRNGGGGSRIAAFAAEWMSFVADLVFYSKLTVRPR